MAMPPFLKPDGRSLLFKNKGELIFYIPEYFFENNYIEVDGRKMKVLGLFNYEVFNENGKTIYGTKLFNYPTVFTCIPSDIVKKKDIKVGNLPKSDYRFLYFREGDVVIESTTIPKSTDNMELFLKMINSGKIPYGVPYDKLHEIFIDNATLNGEKYGVTNQLIGIINSEICRTPSSLNKPFRLSNSSNYNNYTPMNIADVSKYTVPFAAITGEDWNKSLAYAIQMGDGGYSPLEAPMHK